MAIFKVANCERHSQRVHIPGDSRPASRLVGWPPSAVWELHGKKGRTCRVMGDPQRTWSFKKGKIMGKTIGKLRTMENQVSMKVDSWTDHL